ncbi:hypothetical protein [Alicyclobacillus tolerans]|uniref:Uncharacterized protein n=1 Tax=Alicyclobacillus tolerans TaxID=90970 RepID=A0A1M6WS87_9BACL|nr:hypothetical protein [Alicyclobacillus montanus]SHK96593.1 hypothetical protein SAMN05443507_12925 [Alicyclobacillus montanus]
MNDELLEHLCSSLYHLEFLRDALRRVALPESLNQLTWPYGMDYNGYSEGIYEGQLRDLLWLIQMPMDCTLTLTSTDDDELFDHVSLVQGELLNADLLMLMYFTSPEPEQLVEFRYFLQWLRPEDLIMIDTTHESPHVIWGIINPSEDEIMNAWETILRIGEVRIFYGNVAHAHAWRELRG